jgi:hypothetical protein
MKLSSMVSIPLFAAFAFGGRIAWRFALALSV